MCFGLGFEGPWLTLLFSHEIDGATLDSRSHGWPQADASSSGDSTRAPAASRICGRLLRSCELSVRVVSVVSTSRLFLLRANGSVKMGVADPAAVPGATIMLARVREVRSKEISSVRNVQGTEMTERRGAKGILSCLLIE